MAVEPHPAKEAKNWMLTNMFDWTAHFEQTELGLTASELSSTEQRLGLALPDELKALYGALGGGTFLHQDFFGDDDFEYNLFVLLGGRPKGDRESELVDYYQSLAVNKRLIDTDHLPFAVGAGGDVFTVHLKDGSIWFWPMDGDPTPRAVAGSVRELLQELEKAT